MNQTPVTVLTGFLGAGKTTLLNRILSEKHGKKYAVIINEFDALGIDDQLVVQSDEEVLEMNNGCICCTVRGDLIRVLNELSERPGKLDGIIIETTGLADPGPVAQTFFLDESVKESTKLDAIVTVVDSKHVLEHLDSDEAVEQIAFADIILLNKMDLVSEAEREKVRERVRSINGFATVHETTNSAVSLDTVLDRGSFDLDRIVEMEPHFLHDHHHHDHDSDISSFSISVDQPVDPDLFGDWVNMVLSEFGTDIFRSKGIINVKGTDHRFVFQGVHTQVETRWGNPWRAKDKRDSRVVFIGRNLDRDMLRDGFMSCVWKPN